MAAADAAPAAGSASELGPEPGLGLGRGLGPELPDRPRRLPAAAADAAAWAIPLRRRSRPPAAS